MPHLIHGGVMPMLETAIQVAAWEAISRLRHSEAVAMSQSQAFRLYPSRAAEGAELVQNLTPRDTNPALPSLLAYASAATVLNGSLNQELRRTRDELARARMLLSVNGNLAVSFQPQTQAAGLHPINPSPIPPSPRRHQP